VIPCPPYGDAPAAVRCRCPTRWRESIPTPTGNGGGSGSSRQRAAEAPRTLDGTRETAVHSNTRDCRFSPRSCFDELSTSGSRPDFIDDFPLTLSPSKGERAFIDTPTRQGGITGEARVITEPDLAGQMKVRRHRGRRERERITWQSWGRRSGQRSFACSRWSAQTTSWRSLNATAGR